MQKAIVAKKQIPFRTDKNYLGFLNDVKKRLKAAQIRAALASNAEQIKFYWQLGSDLIEKQKALKWYFFIKSRTIHNVIGTLMKLLKMAGRARY